MTGMPSTSPVIPASGPTTAASGRPGRRFWSVVAAVCARNLHNALTTPVLLLPPLAAPLIFYAVWVGGLSALAGMPEFDYPPGYAAFQLPWVLSQGALWTGVYTGIALARDFESGFVRRMLLAVGDRQAVLLGYWATAVVRAVPTIVILLAVGLLIGVPIPDRPLLVAGAIATFAIALAAFSSMWATGVALWIRSHQGTPAMEIPLVILLLLGPAFVPFALMTGWIEVAATGNPLTYLLGAGRDLLAGTTSSTAPALGIAAAMVVAGAVWSTWSLRRRLPG